MALAAGPLEGLMAEANRQGVRHTARTSPLAAMVGGDIAKVGRATLEHRQGALGRYDIRLFRPEQPMLAQTAEDVRRRPCRAGASDT
jgi:hypothetical protein